MTKFDVTMFNIVFILIENLMSTIYFGFYKYDKI